MNVNDLPPVELDLVRAPSQLALEISPRVDWLAVLA